MFVFYSLYLEIYYQYHPGSGHSILSLLHLNLCIHRKLNHTNNDETDEPYPYYYNLQNQLTKTDKHRNTS